MGPERLSALGSLPLRESAGWRGLSTFQVLSIIVGGGALILGLTWRPVALAQLLFLLACVSYGMAALLRIWLLLPGGGRAPHPASVPTEDLPRYSILCALHDEAAVVAQLIRRLSRIDYPPDRLEAFLILESHDVATQQAALATPRPDWLRILIVPTGFPKTKPRALNHALAHVTGDLLTIYDAEDEPSPIQLREAAAAFRSDAWGRLGCVQAPLRIRRIHEALDRSPFIDAQFAAEYAALFEITLPGLARLGLPFPLGGTSNHFRVDILRQVGGWDAFNVTEDADLGFRLWSRGYRLGVIEAPTWESPPGPVGDWLPQRTRWLKGYMQTLGVHGRRPWRLGWRGAASLILTVGQGLAAAALHGFSLLWIVAAILFLLVAGLPPAVPLLGALVLAAGMVAAWLTCLIGARRAGVRYGLAEVVAAPAYWSMLSLAFAHAAWRLVTQPFAWDKTAHRADTPDGHPDPLESMLDARAPDRLSAANAAAPEPVA